MVAMDCSLKSLAYLAGFFPSHFFNPDQVGTVRGKLLKGTAQQERLIQASPIHLSQQRGCSSLGHNPTSLLLDNIG